MLDTICSLFGIRYPIIQGGMAWVANASLAGAVSQAGGLGIIAAANAPAEHVRGEIRRLREMTDRPFGVNIMLMSPNAAEIAELVRDEKVPVVTTGAGLPTRYMKRWLEAGIKVVPVVASAAMARMVEKAGACAVVAEGGEAGGHIGELNTMALVPQVADSVRIPVIAAGGIGDGRGVAAAFMLGARGVQIGTRFLVAKECAIHQNYKNKVLAAKDIDTIVTGRRLGHPVRSLKTQFSRQFQKNESDSGMTLEEMEAFGAGALRRAVVEGDEKNGCFMAGQIAGLVNREQTCAEMIEEICGEAENLLGRSISWADAAHG
jgi:enoyl-[acyl-carrier protein] reductase II